MELSLSRSQMENIASLSAEEERWSLIGICFHKILAPMLKRSIAKELIILHDQLSRPPIEINKQHFARRIKCLPGSKFPLNYANINNNHAHKLGAYDYDVKDPLSLAKLLVPRFMANFTGFDETMDFSACLLVIIEASSSARARDLARNVKNYRNVWAHGGFNLWTDAEFSKAIKEMNCLVEHSYLSDADKKNVFDDLEYFRKSKDYLARTDEENQSDYEAVSTESTEDWSSGYFSDDDREKDFDEFHDDIDVYINEINSKDMTFLKSVSWVKSCKKSVNLVITCKDGKTPSMADLEGELPKELLPRIEFVTSQKQEGMREKEKEKQSCSEESEDIDFLVTPVGLDKDESDSEESVNAELDKKDQSDSEEFVNAENREEDQSESEESIDGELTWFEETFLNDEFQLKNKYKDILNSLDWIQGFYIGPASVASAAANSLQLFIICKKKVTPSLNELQKGFGEHIIYFINFIPGTEFEFFKKDNISDNATPEPQLASAEHSIYHCEDSDKEHGSLGILVEDSEEMLFATTCYHVCYHGKKKCQEDLSRWFNHLTADSRNKTSPTRTSKYCYKCVKDEANGDKRTKLGKFFWGEHNEEHDIALVKLTGLECSCEIRSVPSKLPSRKTIRRKLRKSPTGLAVKKTGFSTGTTEGILIGVVDASLPGRKRADLKECYLVKNKDETKPFSSPGDSGSIVKIVQPNNEEILFGYVVLGCKNERTCCSSLRDSLALCEHLQKTGDENTAKYYELAKEPEFKEDKKGCEHLQKTGDENTAKYYELEKEPEFKEDKKKYFPFPVFLILLVMLVSFALGFIGSTPSASMDASRSQ